MRFASSEPRTMKDENHAVRSTGRSRLNRVFAAVWYHGDYRLLTHLSELTIRATTKAAGTELTGEWDPCKERNATIVRQYAVSDQKKASRRAVDCAALYSPRRTDVRCHHRGRTTGMPRSTLMAAIDSRLPEFLKTRATRRLRWMLT